MMLPDFGLLVDSFVLLLMMAELMLLPYCDVSIVVALLSYKIPPLFLLFCPSKLFPMCWFLKFSFPAYFLLLLLPIVRFFWFRLFFLVIVAGAVDGWWLVLVSPLSSLSLLLSWSSLSCVESASHCMWHNCQWLFGFCFDFVATFHSDKALPSFLRMFVRPSLCLLVGLSFCLSIVIVYLFGYLFHLLLAFHSCVTISELLQLLKGRIAKKIHICWRRWSNRRHSLL